MLENQSPTGAPALSDDFGLEQQAQPVQTTPANDEPAIPAKYQGKSVADLIEMHQNAERRLSQQGNELGEMRRIADGIIGLKKGPAENAKTAPERTPATVDALLTDPERTITSQIETSTVAQRADATASRVDNLEATLARNAFEGKYSNYQADMQDPNFIEWIKKHPLRTSLAAAAYKGDYNAATHLWSLWDEVKTAPQTTQQPADAGRKVQAAKVTRQGSTDNNPPKIYSRAKLMALRERVQDGDQAARQQWDNKEFQDALIVAYQEGRVR